MTWRTSAQWKANTEIIQCVCGANILRKGTGQKYCPLCRRENTLKVQRAAESRRKAEARAAGIKTSIAHRPGIIDPFVREIATAWSVFVVYPFSYYASKNRVYRFKGKCSKGGGHVYTPTEARSFRTGLTYVIREAMKGRRVYRNKIWLQIFVEKPDHRGDAINVVDLVCDAIKDAIGMDDRWFCIKRLDWQIAKSNPHITIGISQEDCFDAQNCYTCGRILSYDKFGPSGGKHKISRICTDCRVGTVVEADSHIVDQNVA